MTTTVRYYAAKGFTLIELLIVVIIIAILAAIAIPQFSSSSAEAQEAALDANLSTVRSAIELYRVQHKNDYPAVKVASGGATSCTTAGGTLGAGGANSEVAFREQLTTYSNQSGATCTVKTDDFPFGPYLRAIPAETINNKTDLVVVSAANTAEPDAATGGWRFNTANGKFQMNSNAVARDKRAYSAH